MRQHGQFVHRLNAPSPNRCRFAKRINRRSFLPRRVLHGLVRGSRAVVLVWPFVPADSEGAPPINCSPNRIGDHGNRRVRNLHHLRHPRNLPRIFIVETSHLPAKHRTARQHGVLHVGQAKINAINRLALNLVRGVNPRNRLAYNLVILSRLERRIGGNGQRGRSARQFSVGKLALGIGVKHGALLRLARRA